MTFAFVAADEAVASDVSDVERAVVKVAEVEVSCAVTAADGVEEAPTEVDADAVAGTTARAEVEPVVVLLAGGS